MLKKICFAVAAVVLSIGAVPLLLASEPGKVTSQHTLPVTTARHWHSQPGSMAAQLMW